MLRLPDFEYHAPRTIEEAVALKAEHGPGAAFVAGGTDLLPNMKRRIQQFAHVIDISRIGELRAVGAGDGIRLGAAVNLEQAAANDAVREACPAYAEAASLVATPTIRHMGTVGGNLCLDTRCLFYNQSYEWRRGIDFCMKADGAICRVAESSPKCIATSSSDTAPVAVAVGATIELHSAAGKRTVDADSFYSDDGIDYLSKNRDELLTALVIPDQEETESAYIKVRARGSFDFPIAGVAVWVRRSSSGAPVEDARVVLGAVFPDPRAVPAAAEALIGKPLDGESIRAAADAAFRAAKPVDNTDGALAWRKEMVRVSTKRALNRLGSAR